MTKAIRNPAFPGLPLPKKQHRRRDRKKTQEKEGEKNTGKDGRRKKTQERGKKQERGKTQERKNIGKDETTRRCTISPGPEKWSEHTSQLNNR